jgi:hypothetical protein
VKPYDQRVAFITGEKYGRLTATEQLKRVNKQTLRLCKCDCGKQIWLPTSRLITGHTKSCGCFRKDFRKLESGEAVRNTILDDYKRNAAKRNIGWNLSQDMFMVLLQGNCFYCDQPPSTIRKARRHNGDYVYNGIDRVSNIGDYSSDNVVSCCEICNRAKSDLNIKEFLSWIKNIYKTNHIISDQL